MLRTRSVLRLLMPGLMLAFVAYHAHTRQAATDHSQTVSHFTPQQILDQSEPICVALAPPAEPLRLSAEYQEVGPRNTWAVDCNDLNGQQIARVWWNNSTGTLLSVSTPARRASGADRPVCSSHQAMRVARRWLYALGCIEPRDAFHGLHVSRLGGSTAAVWIVIGRIPGSRLTMHIDAQNGCLLHASVVRERP